MPVQAKEEEQEQTEAIPVTDPASCLDEAAKLVKEHEDEILNMVVIHGK